MLQPLSLFSLLKEYDSLGCSMNTETCLKNPTQENLHPKKKAALMKDGKTLSSSVNNKIQTKRATKEKYSYETNKNKIY